MRRSKALVSEPPMLGKLMALINLLPPDMRRLNRPGVHELAHRQWNSQSEEEAIVAWFYFRRYVRILPIALEAFVLHDDWGLYSETEHGRLPTFDPMNVQPYQNVELVSKSEQKLQQLVSKAWDRVEREIEILQENPATRKGSQLLAGRWENTYVLAGSEFTAVGAAILMTRARQRFFFILAADEILNALTHTNPQKLLDSTWYAPESGVLRGQLFVQNDEVQLFPPLLYSFFVGVKVSRIHRCGTCENYFWAARKDKLACSLQCAATKRKRKERERYMEIKLGDRIPQPRNSRTSNQSNRALHRSGRKGG